MLGNNFIVLIWSMINLLLLIAIVYLVIKGIRGVIRTVKQQRRNEETIIRQLDKIIKQNSEIISDQAKNKDTLPEDAGLKEKD